MPKYHYRIINIVYENCEMKNYKQVKNFLFSFPIVFREKKLVKLYVIHFCLVLLCKNTKPFKLILNVSYLYDRDFRNSNISYTSLRIFSDTSNF